MTAFVDELRARAGERPAVLATRNGGLPATYRELVAQVDGPAAAATWVATKNAE